MRFGVERVNQALLLVLQRSPERLSLLLEQARTLLALLELSLQLPNLLVLLLLQRSVLGLMLLFLGLERQGLFLAALARGDRSERLQGQPVRLALALQLVLDF